MQTCLMDSIRTVRHPLPVRLLNSAGRVLRRLPFDPLSLAPHRLMSAAVSCSGLEDFGAREFETGLTALTDSAERDAALTPIGRFALRQHIVSALTTRLLEEDLRKRSDGDVDGEEIRPIVIVGLPRSGTTLLHRLLANGPGARGLAYWEVRNPVRPNRRDRRLAWASSHLAMLDRLAPDFKRMHEVSAEAPEECWFLLDSSLVSCTFFMTAPVYSYLDWCLRQDQGPGYRRYREHLMRFAAAQPEKQLVLKTPIHTLNLRLLRQTLPKATIIQIHRDPVACVNSVNSLVRALRGAVTDHIDPVRLGLANLDLLATASSGCVEARADWQGEPIIDVYYDDLVADPHRVLREVLAGMSRPPHAGDEAWLRTQPPANPAARHGGHRYKSSDFMLEDDHIRSKFADYLERFPRLRPASR